MGSAFFLRCMRSGKRSNQPSFSCRLFDKLLSKCSLMTLFLEKKGEKLWKIFYDIFDFFFSERMKVWQTVKCFCTCLYNKTYNKRLLRNCGGYLIYLFIKQAIALIAYAFTVIIIFHTMLVFFYTSFSSFSINKCKKFFNKLFCIFHILIESFCWGYFTQHSCLNTVCILIYNCMEIIGGNNWTEILKFCNFTIEKGRKFLFHKNWPRETIEN